MLVVMAGLPGSGKSVLARAIGIALNCAVVAVDTIEIGMRLAGVETDQPIGLAAYEVAQALADEELSLGHTIVIDAVNAAPPARRAWHALARSHETNLLVVEVQCTDDKLHRQRVVERKDKVPPVTWEQVCVLRDEYTAWDTDTVQIDSSDEDVNRMLREVLAAAAFPTARGV